MISIKNSITLKTLINFAVFIIILFGAFVAIDNRYLKAEDAYKKFQKIDKSLDRIYIHQLKQETREILKDIRWRPATETEKRRLQDITEELQNLGSYGLEENQC